MKPRYRLFLRRRSVYYAFDNHTKSFESLNTKDKQQALRLVAALNESSKSAALNRQIAQVYWRHSDSDFPNRDWQHVMAEGAKTKHGPNRERWERAMREQPFDHLRLKKLVNTTAEDFIQVLAMGAVSTNTFLRRLQNFAVDMNWLPAPIILRRQWPRIKFKDRRGIREEEHLKVLAGERNPEWLAYYKVLWHLGGSQSDVAGLCAEDVDWELKVISFRRMKTGARVQIHFGATVAGILSDLPGAGFLFPRISQLKESDRASLLNRRCRLVGVSGVSLHSYRYAWAERARSAGYPERFAQEALGHGSKAVHRAYAKRAVVQLPPLEDYERQQAAGLTGSLGHSKHEPAALKQACSNLVPAAFPCRPRQLPESS